MSKFTIDKSHFITGDIYVTYDQKLAPYIDENHNT